MALPDFTMRGLLEAGAHFGHQSHRWNPKMAPFIFGARNNIHIIDLAQTVPLLHQALKTVSDTVSKGGRVLFVGTKRQAQEQIADAAKRSAQYYINSRWLGGTLTNWKTISGSITRLRKLDEQLRRGASGITKKERLLLTRERDKLEKALGGIKDMGGTPDLIFVIDTNKEQLAIKEANRLKIPVVADPRHQLRSGWHHPSDSRQRRRGPRHRALLRSVARAAIDGISRSQGSRGHRFRRDGGSAEPRSSRPVSAKIASRRGRRRGCETPLEAFELLSAPRGAPDDLAKLHGVGPQLVKKLNDAGVFHYWQLAAMTPADVEKLDADLKLNGRIARDGWVDQARSLAA